MSIDVKTCPHATRYVAQCGICQASWCYECDPGPAALCHYCHGRGYSTHEIDPPVCSHEEPDTAVYRYVVTVKCESSLDAERVIGERLAHDEDYGFDYSLDWAVV